MRLLFKAVLLMAVIGVLALGAYAIFFDLPAPTRDITLPVEPR